MITRPLYFLFLVVGGFLAAPAQAETWRDYQTQGENGLKLGYLSYAYFKFGQAWLAINDPTYQSPGYSEVRRNLISS